MEVNRFDPVNLSARQEIFFLFLSIENRTLQAVRPGEYSVALYDGRNYKPLKIYNP